MTRLTSRWVLIATKVTKTHQTLVPLDAQQFIACARTARAATRFATVIACGVQTTVVLQASVALKTAPAQRLSKILLIRTEGE